MTNKEKMSKIFDEYYEEYSGCHVFYFTEEESENLANYCEEKGMIVLPCKPGETVYTLETFVDLEKCEKCDYYYEGGMGDHPDCNRSIKCNIPIECIRIKKEIATLREIYWWLYMGDFGKRVFATEEEAITGRERLR